MKKELLLGIWEAEKKTVLFVTHDIDEAVFMGSRVVVMSARPARIELDRAVPLPHPRHYAVPRNRKVLGFTVSRGDARIKVAPKAIETLKSKIRELNRPGF